tara:strand:+ start:1717 stop:1908 length:192 start_codon:yes stop_codon:yes gene_type:complete
MLEESKAGNNQFRLWVTCQPKYSDHEEIEEVAKYTPIRVKLHMVNAESLVVPVIFWGPYAFVS